MNYEQRIAHSPKKAIGDLGTDVMKSPLSVII